MKLLFSIILTLSTLLASNILTYKLYDRSDNGRLDILLTFDTPYQGRITQKKVDATTTLLLYDALYSSTIKKTLNSDYLTSFSLTPDSGRTALSLTMPEGVTFNVSQTVDSYGLRLRFEKGAGVVKTQSKPTALNKLKALTTKESFQTKTTTPTTKTEPLISKRYAIVLGILFAAVLLLFIIKKRVEKGRKPGSWLFKDNPHNLEEFTILFQKPLDSNNKIVLMEFGNRQYLVIVGTTNLLLDTFSDKESVNEAGFESILKENQQELDDYMRIQSKEEKSPLQSYKDKASLEVYRSQI